MALNGLIRVGNDEPMTPRERQHCVDCKREVNATVSVERAFYIGSPGIANAETFAKAARSHWTIDNSLHWVLDVTTREDDCRVRKDHAPHNFATLRKFALSLLRQDTQYLKRSLRARRKTAERLPDYRASLLGLIPRGAMIQPDGGLKDQVAACKAHLS